MSTALIAHVLSAMDRMTRANPRVCERAMNFTRSFMGVVSFHGMPQHAGDLLPMSPGAGLICYLCRRSGPEKTLDNFWVTREEMARVERKHLIGGFTFIQARSS